MAKLNPTMLVADVFEHKARMERAIAGAVLKALVEFEDATGFTPSGVDIRMVPVQKIGQERPDYVVDRVEVDLGL